MKIQAWMLGFFIVCELLIDMAQYEISSSDEELPFACYICREVFKTPIVTKYAHNLLCPLVYIMPQGIFH